MMLTTFILRFRQNTCHFWKVVLLAVLICITYLALTGNPPQITKNFGDKLNHIGAFFALDSLVWLGFIKLKHYARIGIVFSYGICIEVLQSQLTHRVASIWDIGADGVGILLSELLIAGFYLTDRQK